MCELYDFVCDVETYFTHSSQNDTTYCKINSPIIFESQQVVQLFLNDFVAMRKIEHSQKSENKCF